MQTTFLKITLGLFLVFLSFTFQNLSAESFSLRENLEQVDLENYQCIVLSSLENLSFDQTNILLKTTDEHCYCVHNLQRMGNQWLATIHCQQYAYCQGGHAACKHCGLCHTTWCRYYVRPCNQWKN